MPDAGILASILLLVGLVLIVVEFFVPSGGLIGILAAVSLMASIWAAWKAWWVSNPTFFWTYTGLWMVLIPGTLVGTVLLLEKTSLGDRILLRAPRPEEVAPCSDERNRLEGFIGTQAVAVTLLTPGGMIEIDGERIHAESEGMLVEPNTPVQVVGVVANRLRVRVVSDNEPATDTDEHAVAEHASSPTGTSTADAEEAAAVVRRSDIENPALAETVTAGHQNEAESPRSETDAKVAKSDRKQQPESAAQGEVLDFDIPQDYTAG